MIDKLDPSILEKWDHTEADEKPSFDGDEDFINYLYAFTAQVQAEIQMSHQDKKKREYLMGMLFALKSISQVYEDLIKGKFI
jgi:hypothetical protein